MECGLMARWPCRNRAARGGIRRSMPCWPCMAPAAISTAARVGHSLGAIKAIHFAAHVAHPEVKRLVAISPPRLSYAYYLASERHDEFKAHYDTAREHVAAGRGETLMEIRTPLPFLVSAA